MATALLHCFFTCKRELGDGECHSPRGVLAAGRRDKPQEAQRPLTTFNDVASARPLAALDPDANEQSNQDASKVRKPQQDHLQ